MFAPYWMVFCKVADRIRKWTHQLRSLESRARVCQRKEKTEAQVSVHPVLVLASHFALSLRVSESAVLPALVLSISADISRGKQEVATESPTNKSRTLCSFSSPWLFSSCGSLTDCIEIRIAHPHVSTRNAASAVRARNP